MGDSIRQGGISLISFFLLCPICGPDAPTCEMNRTSRTVLSDSPHHGSNRTFPPKSEPRADFGQSTLFGQERNVRFLPTWARALISAQNVRFLRRTPFCSRGGTSSGLFRSVR